MVFGLLLIKAATVTSTLWADMDVPGGAYVAGPNSSSNLHEQEEEV